MIRWTQFLAPLKFAILYKPGKTNVVADALSKRLDYASSLLTLCYNSYSHYLATSVNSTELDTYFTKALHADLTYKASLANVPLHLRANNNKLWRMDAKKVPSLIVPHDHPLKSFIIKQLHEKPWSGHLGYAKTLHTLRCQFFWPQMQSGLLQLIRECDVCQKYKPLNTPPQGLLQPLCNATLCK